MKILIIAYYYPPETYAMMASLRPHSWAKYWSQAGHEIRILTNYKQRNQSELNPRQNVLVEEVRYRPFSSSSVKSCFNETKHKKNNDSDSFLNNKIRQSLIFLQKELGAGTLLYGSNFWTFSAYFSAIKMYDDWPFEMIVSTYGPPTNHITASLLKKKYHLFWVADYRDLWSDYSFTKSNVIFRKIEQKIESNVISKADLFSTISDALNTKLKQSFKKNVVTIENGFDQDTLIGYCLPQKSTDKKIKLVYTGSIYPNKRDPSALFRSLNYLEASEKEQIEIIFVSYNLDYLEKLNQELNGNKSVNLLNFIPREECLKLQASADLLIFLDWNDPNIEGILTGKIFEYMVAGTPVINIGCDHETDASRLITESGIGVNLGNDPQAIAAYLKRLLQGEKPYYQPNQRVIEKYSRKKLAEKMLEQILHYKNQWDSNQT